MQIELEGHHNARLALSQEAHQRNSSSSVLMNSSCITVHDFDYHDLLFEVLGELSRLLDSLCAYWIDIELALQSSVKDLFDGRPGLGELL